MQAKTVCAHCGEVSEGRPLICERCGQDPRVQSRYRLEGELGRGGSAVTWRARREPSGEPVCLKELRWATLANLDDERRFAREGELLEGLEHPSIPKHHGAFAWGEGRAHALYIAQELVVGDNLEVERRARGYTAKEALAIGAELAEVLAYLHERHPPVVHRDLKPSNIMRRVDGRLMLIDFGAARIAGLGQSQLSVAGTFGFMAPEQIRGEAGTPADVYGLGMTLAVLLAGGAPEDLLDESNRPDFTRVPALRSDLRQLLEDMCQVDAAARPSAAEVARRCRDMLAGREPLKYVLSTAPAPQPVVILGDRPPAASGAGRAIALVALAMVLLTVAGTAIFITSSVTDTINNAVSWSSTVTTTSSTQWIVTNGDAISTVALPHASAAAAPEPPPAAVPAAAPLDPLPIAAEGCASGQASSCEPLAKELFGARREALVALPGWPEPLRSGCERGAANACEAAARVYAQGIGVPVSRIETRQFYGKACGAGDLASCNSYGHMLLKGDGGPSDWKAALGPLETACGATPPDDDACLTVGAIYAEGKHGARADRPKALGIFEGLCKKGIRPACQNVDAMVGNNWGLPASGAPRVAAFERLCELPSGAACLRLGDAYAKGSGVKKDTAKAAQAYAKGCDVGLKAACEKMR